jgi:hypothetical protein
MSSLRFKPIRALARPAPKNYILLERPFVLQAETALDRGGKSQSPWQKSGWENLLEILFRGYAAGSDD